MSVARKGFNLDLPNVLGRIYQRLCYHATGHFPSLCKTGIARQPRAP